MYYCRECQHFFEEPTIVFEDPSPPGITLPAGYCEYTYCPVCGGSNITPARKCDICGEDSVEQFCDSCRKEVVNHIDGLFNLLSEDVPDVEPEELKELMFESFEEWDLISRP